MKKKNFVCIECPRGCALTVTVGDGISVEGNFCPKGKAYAEAEVTCPRRIVTSSVRGEYGMISVKTDRPVKKTKIFEIMRQIRAAKLFTNVAIGDIIIENADGEGANVIATRPYANIPRED